MATKLYNPGRERPVRQYLLRWFAIVHLLGAIGVVYLIAIHFSWATIAMTGALFLACHLSITAGVHRIYSHRCAPKVSRLYEILTLTFFSGTFQSDARWWVCRHRDHHNYEDTERDPYTTKHGLGWAHWLWILHDTGKVDPADVPPDLARNRLLDWQAQNWLILGIPIGFVLPMAVATLWGDPLGGLLVGGFLRLVVQYHSTWSINSIAHKFGSFRYVRRGTARTQGHWIWFPVITVGEGTSHERHHLAPEDYRIDPRWWAIDVGKWFMWTCSKIGLLGDLRTVPEETVIARSQRKRRAIMG